MDACTQAHGSERSSATLARGVAPWYDHRQVYYSCGASIPTGSGPPDTMGSWMPVAIHGALGYGNCRLCDEHVCIVEQGKGTSGLQRNVQGAAVQQLPCHWPVASATSQLGPDGTELPCHLRRIGTHVTCSCCITTLEPLMHGRRRKLIAAGCQARYMDLRLPSPLSTPSTCPVTKELEGCSRNSSALEVATCHLQLLHRIA